MFQDFMASIHKASFWSHATITTVHAICLSPTFRVLMEYGELGPLDKYLSRLKNKLDIYSLIMVTEQLGQSLLYLVMFTSVRVGRLFTQTLLTPLIKVTCKNSFFYCVLFLHRIEVIIIIINLYFRLSVHSNTIQVTNYHSKKKEIMYNIRQIILYNITLKNKQVPFV